MRKVNFFLVFIFFISACVKKVENVVVVPQEEEDSITTNEQIDKPQNEEIDNNQSSTEEVNVTALNLDALKPQNGKLYASVELVGDRAKISIIDLDEKGNWIQRFTDSSIYFEEDGANNFLKEVLSKIDSKGKVSQSKIVFFEKEEVSGKGVNNQIKELIESNKLYSSLSYYQLSKEDQIKYLYISSLPQSMRNNSFVYFMNDKEGMILYTDNNKIKTVSAQSYRTNETSKKTKISIIKSKLASLPDAVKNNCFFVIANKVNNNKANPYELVSGNTLKDKDLSVIVKAIESNSPNTKIYINSQANIANGLLIDKF